IISDGLRFDMLEPSVMPVWSELASKSQVFEHHLSTGNATRFGIYGLFTGLFAHYWFDSLNNKTSPVLFEELKKQQYEFGFFANARLTSPEFDKAIFSTVSEYIPQKTAGKNVIEREYEITRQAKSFIQKNTNKPFFGLVFFDAPHAYVNPPQDNKFQPALKSLNYLKINNESDPLPFLNRYKNAVHFTDRLTAELLETLKQQGIMDNTIIIMTGDHGQESNETLTNSWGHNSNFSKYQIQVPLVIYWPGKQPQVYSQLTSHVDIVPTLMQEIFSCSNPVRDYSNGQSLFDQHERKFVMVNNWNNQAIVNKTQVKIFPKIGPAEYRDYNGYQQKSSDQFKTIPTSDVIESISRYYR
ncbi:MAG: sulfatase-like hydrolase/transferase, partial [Gammaproteobacteria bacterium]|nr:sulfatase-like hydrolase/transferase [Gammaproteobacteria bacterium]